MEKLVRDLEVNQNPCGWEILYVKRFPRPCLEDLYFADQKKDHVHLTIPNSQFPIPKSFYTLEITAKNQ